MTFKDKNIEDLTQEEVISYLNSKDKYCEYCPYNHTDDGVNEYTCARHVVFDPIRESIIYPYCNDVYVEDVDKDVYDAFIDNWSGNYDNGKKWTIKRLEEMKYI